MYLSVWLRRWPVALKRNICPKNGNMITELTLNKITDWWWNTQVLVKSALKEKQWMNDLNVTAADVRDDDE